MKEIIRNISHSGPEGCHRGDPHQVRPAHIRVRPRTPQIPRTRQICVSRLSEAVFAQRANVKRTDVRTDNVICRHLFAL